MGILKKLLIVVIFLLPLGEVGRYLIPAVGNIPVVINDVVVLVLVSLWIGIKVYRKERVDKILWFPFGVFFSVCTCSLFVNSYLLTLSQFLVAFSYLIRIGAYLLLAVVITDTEKQFQEKVVWYLLISGQIVVGIGYIQYFFYPFLGNLFYLGWDDHLYRMFSVFLDPNFAGIFFALVFLLTMAQGIYHLTKKLYPYAGICFFLSVFDFIAVYLSYSRSALLMLLVSISVFLFLYKQKKYIIAACIMLLCFIFIAPKSFQTEGTNLLRITSTEARIQSSKYAIAIIEKNPLIGVGFNAYRYAQNRYGFISGPYWITSHGGSGTDNSFLFVLATTGVIGFGAYIYMWVRIFQNIWKTRDSTNDVLHIATLSSCIGVGVSAFFINSLFYIFILEWLMILVGVTVVYKKKKN